MGQPDGESRRMPVFCIRNIENNPFASRGYQNERRLEFTFENHRYFDMRRWVLPLNEEVEGVAVTRKEDGTFSFKVQKVEQRKYEVKNYFMPLPYAELEKNKNLMNNQGWE